MKKKIFYLVLLQIVLLFVLSSCKNETNFHERNILINGLNKFKPDTSNGYTSLEILEAYPVNKDCSYLRHYFNLYVCKTRLKSTVDTVYIFDECANNTFSSNNIKAGFEIGFYTNNTLKNQPKQVIILVPDTFRIPPNAKYLFNKLSHLTEL